jgi:hypothetical protein
LSLRPRSRKLSGAQLVVDTGESSWFEPGSQAPDLVDRLSSLLPHAWSCDGSRCSHFQGLGERSRCIMVTRSSPVRFGALISVLERLVSRVLLIVHSSVLIRFSLIL